MLVEQALLAWARRSGIGLCESEAMLGRFAAMPTPNRGRRRKVVQYDEIGLAK